MEFLQSINERLNIVSTDLDNWMAMHMPTVAVIAVMVLTVWYVIWYFTPAVTYWWRTRKEDRENWQELLKKGEAMRRRSDDRIVADGVHNYLLTMHVKGDEAGYRLSRKRYNHYNRLLGMIWPDLLTKARGERLKAMINERLGTHKPVKIPGPPPGGALEPLNAEVKTKKRRGFHVVSSK
jgi:hypothetical protein